MNNAEARASLVEALASVPELTPTPTKPPAVTAGAAWPVWTKTIPVNYCNRIGTWLVYVALPAGTLGTTVERGDALAPEVEDALLKVAKLVQYEPWEWLLDAGRTTVPGLRFTLEVG